MAPKVPQEQPSDVDTARAEVSMRVAARTAYLNAPFYLQFITKLSTAAEAMRQFGNFADALAKVVAKAPLDEPEVVAALQAAIDAIPATSSRKRKLTSWVQTKLAPPSAYILFQNDVRNDVRKKNPDIQYRELMSLISQQWNALPVEKKQPFFDRVTAAKQIHEEELAKYNAANLNHVPSEGTSKTPKKELPAEKPEKKVISKPTKPAPKSAEAVASSESGGASDDESNEEEKGEGEDKGSDVGSSEEESDEPTPPPAKKVKKADKRK
ncbi:hypothetical protein JVT61DRAFT_3797 [Boletus reticuloceps]|uniref:HMG box domain-containing protein n=1 Tax=Boletus reticuloceps TaxID=495285 RepID=A0A8I3A9E4_9AGAM|nr:hypothetical protein JVT61DRAFT_3797 [Boletus reticuloceps]